MLIIIIITATVTAIDLTVATITTTTTSNPRYNHLNHTAQPLPNIITTNNTYQNDLQKSTAPSNTPQSPPIHITTYNKR
jgi:hypothetical protein